MKSGLGGVFLPQTKTLQMENLKCWVMSWRGQPGSERQMALRWDGTYYCHHDTPFYPQPMFLTWTFSQPPPFSHRWRKEMCNKGTTFREVWWCPQEFRGVETTVLNLFWVTDTFENLIKNFWSLFSENWNRFTDRMPWAISRLSDTPRGKKLNSPLSWYWLALLLKPSK